MKLWNKIDRYIKDLPNHEDLAMKIAMFVIFNKTYTLAQVGAIIDDYYGKSCGLSIAEDIKCLFYERG